MLLNVVTDTGAAERSQDDVAAVGRQIEQAYNDRDTVALRKIIDLKALALRIGHDLNMPEASLPSFTRGFLQGGGNTLIVRLVDDAERNGGTAKMMRVIRRGNELRPLIRLDYGENGFDYVEFIVAQDTEKSYRVVDWVPLTLGEPISRVVGSASRLLADPDPTWFRSLVGKTELDSELIAQIRSIGALEKDGKYREALVALKKLPPDIANSKIFVFKEISLASATNDDDLYKDALRHLAKLYGNEPTAAFLLIDYYVLEGQTDKAIKGIESIQASVGEDGLTESLKAALLSTADRNKEMLVYAKNAVRLEPDRLNSHALLAVAHQKNSRYDDAVVAYKRIESDFGVEFTSEDFTDDPDASAFVKSAAYSSWMKSKSK
jgi:tetratricopeptide (TPR) repeat protein